MPEEKNVHKLKKSSAYSFSVTIPKEIVEKYKRCGLLDTTEHQNDMTHGSRASQERIGG